MIPWEEFYNVVLATIGVLFLFLLLAYCVKKIKPNNMLKNKSISVVANVSLGGKEKVCLLDVEGKKLVIGMTPNSIQTLMVLNEKK